MSRELKRIHPEAISKALDLGERYRLLNEPEQTESIARDVLAVDAENQQAIRMLALALSDQFLTHRGGSMQEAEALLARLQNPYERAYFRGVVIERWARAKRQGGLPAHAVDEHLRRAMDCFEEAERLRPPGNDDAILRWNTCARMLRHDDREDAPLYGD